MDNIRNEFIEERTKTPVPEYNVPEYKTPVPEYNNVWANFDSKKIISCNARPTLDEIYLDHRRPQHPNREVKRETLEKKIVFQDTRRRKPVDKEEEYCLNLGRYIVYRRLGDSNIFAGILSNLIKVHPLVKSQFDNKTSSLRSYTIQQRTRYV